jgi:hypothetical protein
MTATISIRNDESQDQIFLGEIDASSGALLHSQYRYTRALCHFLQKYFC